MADKKVEFQITAKNRTTTAFKSAERSMQGLKASASALTGAFAALGVGIGLVGLTGLIKNTLKTQDELAKMSQKIGISVEALAGLQHAGELAGVSLSGIQKAVKSLSTQLFDAASGLIESRRNFASLGLEIRNNDGTLRDAEDVIVELADKFADLEDGTEKTALATKIFGKAGLDLIPLLNQGSQALAEMVQEGKELNPVTAESAKQSEIFNDNLSRLQKRLGTVGIEIVNTMLPALSRLSDKFATAAVETNNFWQVLLGSALTSGEEADKPSETIRELEQSLSALELTLKELNTSSQTSFLHSIFNKDDVAIVETQIDLVRAKLASLKIDRNQALEDIFVEPSLFEKQGGGFEAKIIDDTKNREIASAKKKIDDFNTSLDREIELLGKSAVEVTVYKAALAGIKEEDLEAVRVKAEKREAIKTEIGFQKILTDAQLKEDKALVSLIEKTKQRSDASQKNLDRLNFEATLTEENADERRKALKIYDAEIEKKERLAELAGIAEGADKEAIKASIEASERRSIEAAEIERDMERREAQFDQLNQFGVQAARSMQTAFADFLFDPFDKGLSGMLSSFADTIRRMAAEIAAQHILTAFLGASGGGGFLGGIFSAIGGIAGSFFGGGTSGGFNSLTSGTGPTQIPLGFADGGIHKGGMRLVGENGPELEITGPSRILNNKDTKEALSGSNVNVTNNFALGLSQEVRIQLAAEMPNIVKQTVEAVTASKKRAGRIGGQL